MEAPAEGFLTVTGLAARWGKHPKTIYRLVESRQLPHLRLGPRGIRFRLSDIEKFETASLVSGLVVESRAAQGLPAQVVNAESLGEIARLIGAS